MKKLIPVLFILLLLAQWILPGSMIWQKEEVLSKGKAFKFLTEPIDPSRPFKGKYVALSFKENTYPVGKEYFIRDQQVYVSLNTDEAGFAKITGLSSIEPKENTNYIIATFLYQSSRDDEPLYFLEYPFEEFYLDEFKAPMAEKIYRESNANPKSKTYALVKVYKGNGVIEDLIINDTSIHKLIGNR